MQYDALILAGGVLDTKLRQFGNVSSKAFLELGDKSMLEYVVDALRGSGVVSRLFIVAPDENMPISLNGGFAGIIRSGNTLFESLNHGIKGIPNPSSKILICAADSPLISPKAVSNFVSSSEEFEADLYYPFVEKHDSETMFPGLPHTWVMLHEGVFCGGGMIILNPARFKSLAEFAKKITTYRKTPWKLITLFGFWNAVKFAIKKLKIAELELKGTQLLGFPVKGIRSPDPEIAFNVDDPESFVLAAKALGVPIPH